MYQKQHKKHKKLNPATYVNVPCLRASAQTHQRATRIRAIAQRVLVIICFSIDEVTKMYSIQYEFKNDPFNGEPHDMVMSVCPR
jgi:hypothetical protein